MYVVAVTGGLGAGKSSACEYFARRGAVVLNADEIARHAISPGTKTFDRVVEQFGPGVLDPDGSVDRAALAKLAFATSEATCLLNSIVHPAVVREVMEGINQLRLLERPPRIVIIEVPLLVEVPVLADIVDGVLSIEAPEELRVARAVESGVPEDDARLRMSRQATDAQRSDLATCVIVNATSREDFEARLAHYWAEVAPGDA